MDELTTKGVLNASQCFLKRRQNACVHIDDAKMHETRVESLDIMRFDDAHGSIEDRNVEEYIAKRAGPIADITKGPWGAHTVPPLKWLVYECLAHTYQLAVLPSRC